MLLKDYIKKIYVYRIPKKSFKFIDSIVIYLDNKRVYKVLIRYNERHRSALRKLKIYSIFRFITDAFEEVIDDELISKDNHERLTIIYNIKKDISSVFVGEDYKILANQ